MCGVFAYVGKGGGNAEACLDKLAHRGPDAAVVTHEKEVTLGHRRLSIIDVDARSNEPLVSVSGKSVIVFNGEIYNYRTLREELVREGAHFATEGDTEVILAGYELHGAAFFERMRGMWAFVLHDRVKNQLVTARDPFGIKPLVYAVGKDALFFASEIKCLKNAFPLEPDPQGYAAFYNLGYFITPQTPYKNVYRLQAGEVCSWDINSRQRTELSCVSRFMETRDLELSPATLLDTLDTALTDSVEAHYVSDVPVSMLLSGGTDSSLIAALSKKIGKNPTAYHVAIEGSKDTEYAKDVAAHLGMSLQIEPLTQESLETQYDKIWDLLDEPTGELSIIPTSLVFERIRGKAKVVLSGEGGDELFGGYLRHSLLASHTRVSVQDTVNSFFNSLIRKDGGSTLWNPVIERLRTQALSRGGDDLVGAYLNGVRLMRYPFEDMRVRRQLAELYAAESDSRVLPMLAFDLISYLPNDLLPKTDIASMASSIEARVPLVDRRVATIVSQVLQVAGKPRGDKLILKEILARYIPHELAFRGKSGFGVPMHAYNSKRFVSDFHHACAFHLANHNSFGVSDSMARVIEGVCARDTITRKYPRFAFALISNWKLHA